MFLHQVWIKTSVTPASGEACFIIVPCTYLPGQDAPFAISVSSSCPVVFEPILERPSITSLWVEQHTAALIPPSNCLRETRILTLIIIVLAG
jgi:hypothetical protein